jgi:hypothetical protein
MMQNPNSIDRIRALMQTECFGHSNAKTMEKISIALDLDSRTCRILIRELRVNEKIPIISLSTDDVTGYFIMNPKDQEDRKYGLHYVRASYHQAGEIIESCQSVKNGLDDDDQPTLADWILNIDQEKEAERQELKVASSGNIA